MADVGDSLCCLSSLRHGTYNSVGTPYVSCLDRRCVLCVRQGPVAAVGPDSVLGGRVPRRSSAGARHHRHGPGTDGNDGEVCQLILL